MRKQPKQQRSREMVANLVEATATVIAQRGLDNTTTNHVADAAGVSVGSLYQYFPDKSALIEALLERMVADLELAFDQRLADYNIEDLDLEAVIRLTLAIGLSTLRANGLYLELVRNWHRLPVVAPLSKLEQYMIAMGQQYFVAHIAQYPVKNLQAKLYVLINSTLLFLSHYLSQEHPKLKEEQVHEALIAMICHTLTA